MEKISKHCLVALMATACASAITASSMAQTKPKIGEWTAWGGDGAVTHFSPLTQITPANVAQLKPIWVYDSQSTGRSWENTPLMIGGLLYFSDPDSTDVVALEPETGKEIWRHKAPPAGTILSRGLSYWPGDGKMAPRLISYWGANMVGIDLKTGKSSADWPSAGYDIGLPNGQAKNKSGGLSRSVPVVYKNMIVLSGASGFQPGPGTPADPRAYDLRTGKLLWRTRLIPDAGQEGGDSWGPAGKDALGSGTWGFMTVDAKSNTIYMPTDSPSPDLVGIWRPGDNKWADSTVALDADTGKIKWAFQNHHHDIFDYDTMAAPVPVTITQNGKKRDIVVQTTKQGMMWILDAKTGNPIFPYEERPVPQSEIPGEKSSPTQPFTQFPPPLAKMGLTRDELLNVTPEANAQCKQVWDQLQLKESKPFQPPAKNGAWTLMLPGADGGIDWGGTSIDVDHGLAITNLSNLPTMVQVTQGTPAVKGNNGWRFSSGYVRISTEEGVPCYNGPLGELVAVKLDTGKVVWRVPVGSMENIYGEKGKKMGATTIGPSVVTRGGVIFIGGTIDQKMHAYETKTGKLLWETKMSAMADSGPATYMGKDGRQYVVITAGGPGTTQKHTVGSPDDERGELYGYRQTLVAFAIPKPGEKEADIDKAFPRRLPKPGEKWPS